MKTCPKCGGTNRPEANFCTRCGSWLPAPAEGGEAQRLRQLLPDQWIKGQYRIIDKIGEGGLGRVYLAQDSSGRKVAIKQIRELDAGLDSGDYEVILHSFQREANILSSLPHPYLPIARDYIVTGESFFIVMDYIEGQSLAQLLEDAGGPLPESRVLTWTTQVCEALSYLHSKRPPIIHRNIKPKNILLENPESDRVRLVGFGLARFYIDGLECDEDNLGTPGYSPPEQYGLAQTDARSDLFSLGATMFALLSGSDPANFVQIDNRPVEELQDGDLEQVRFNIPDIAELNPQISSETRQIIQKALCLDPDLRYQTAEEMRSALDEVLAEGKSTPESVVRYVLEQPVAVEETRYHEFKEIKGLNPVRSIRKIVDEYVVAFLNREGGRIYWGIRDEDRVVVGVRLNFRQRDEVRRAITDQVSRIQPALAPSAYQINFHEVYQDGQAVTDLFLVEVVVPRSQTNLLYFTGINEVFVKTDAGKKKLSGLELQDEIVRRLEKGRRG